MANDFAANILKDIVEKRSQLAGDTTDSTETFLKSATQQAKHILSYGLSISIHISLVPLKCQCSGKCQKAVDFEVWTIRTMRVDKNDDASNSSIMPIFLQQAVFSQLFFSPFSAWLKEKSGGRLPKSHRCVFRITTSTESVTSKLSKMHSFPCCIFDRNGKEALKVDVEWMSKSEFPELVDCCNSTKLNTEKHSNDQETDPILIDDRPIQQTFTETHTLANFSTSSSPGILMEKKRIRRNTTGCETKTTPKQNEYRNVCKGSPVPWSQPNSLKQLNKTSPSSSGLLCNFEESALKGRLQPINSIEGFKLQLIIQDRFNTSPLEFPMTTYFFNVSDDNSPSLYLGHCALNENGRKPIRISSKHSTLQATVFNPQGSVVKIFIVPINVNIPNGSKSFVRQRTYCLPKGLTIEKAERSSLRYLAHFRLISDRKGRLFIHTEIKLLFTNKVDMDVQNLVSGQQFHLVTSTECPKESRS